MTIRIQPSNVSLCTLNINFWNCNRVTHVTHSCTVSFMCVCMCGVSVAYTCLCVCTIFPALQMIFLEDENVNIIVFVIELTALACTYIIKNLISRFFFPISSSHKRISLFLYMSPWLYLQDDCAVFTIHDVLLINIAVEKIDLLQWELSFSLFLFGITTTHFWWRNFLSIYLSYLLPFLFLSLCFTFGFLTVMHLMCVSIMCLFFTHFPISPLFKSFSLCKKLRAKLVAVKQREYNQPEHNIFLNSIRICFG